MKLPLKNWGKLHSHKGGSQEEYEAPQYLLKGQNGGTQKSQEISGKHPEQFFDTGVQVADKLSREDTQLGPLLKKKKKKQTLTLEKQI